MPTCTSVNALIAAQPCYGANNLNSQQRKALMVFFKATELAAIGSTNYTSVLNSTLLTAANSFVGQAKGPINSFNMGTEFEQAALIIAKNNAVAAGGSVSSNINTLMQSIVPLSKATERQLDAMLLFLECALGQAKPYPQ